MNSFQLLELPCRHRHLNLSTKNDMEFDSRTARYLQIRRCSSCRLRRCFAVGMNEQLIRTEEENLRHKELIEINRTRRDALKQQLMHIQQLAIPQVGHSLKRKKNMKKNLVINVYHLSFSCRIFSPIVP